MRWILPITLPITATGTNGARSSTMPVVATASSRVNTSAGRFSIRDATTSGAVASGTMNSDKPNRPTCSCASARTTMLNRVKIASMALSRYTVGSSIRR